MAGSNVTHDQMEAMTMADQIDIMKIERCEESGTPKELYQERVSEMVAKGNSETLLFPISKFKALSDPSYAHDLN